MSNSPNTDAAIERIANRREVLKSKDGEIANEFLSPTELLALRKLEIQKATDEARETSGFMKKIV